jgi:hypothetical protein
MNSYVRPWINEHKRIRPDDFDNIKPKGMPGTQKALNEAVVSNDLADGIRGANLVPGHI